MSGINDLVQVIEGMSEEDLTRELDALEERADLIRFALTYIRGRGRTTTPAEPQIGVREPVSQISPRRPPQNRRKAILALMGEQPDRTWHYRDFRAEMIRNGWLEPDARADHALGVAMGKMVKDGLLHRPERGYYRLAPTDQAGLGDDGSAEP